MKRLCESLHFVIHDDAKEVDATWTILLFRVAKTYKNYYSMHIVHEESNNNISPSLPSNIYILSKVVKYDAYVKFQGHLANSFFFNCSMLTKFCSF